MLRNFLIGRLRHYYLYVAWNSADASLDGLCSRSRPIHKSPYLEEFDKAIIHPKELPQTKQSLEKQLAEAREEKGDLEKTYRYAVHEIKKLQEKLANHHIENEDGQRQILSGESGIICDSFKTGQSFKFENEL